MWEEGAKGSLSSQIISHSSEMEGGRWSNLVLGEEGRRERKGGGGGGGGGKLNAFIPEGIINESHLRAKISRTTYVTLMELKYPEFYTYTVLMYY